MAIAMMSSLLLSGAAADTAADSYHDTLFGWTVSAPYWHVWLSQPITTLFRVEVAVRAIPEAVQRVHLELWSDVRGRSGYNVTLYDDAARWMPDPTSPGSYVSAGNGTDYPVVTYFAVHRQWLEEAYRLNEKAYVVAHAYKDQHAMAPEWNYQKPGQPYESVESNRATVLRRTASDASSVALWGDSDGAAKGLVDSCTVSGSEEGFLARCMYGSLTSEQLARVMRPLYPRSRTRLITCFLPVQYDPESGQISFVLGQEWPLWANVTLPPGANSTNCSYQDAAGRLQPGCGYIAANASSLLTNYTLVNLNGLLYKRGSEAWIKSNVNLSPNSVVSACDTRRHLEEVVRGPTTDFWGSGDDSTSIAVSGCGYFFVK